MKLQLVFGLPTFATLYHLGSMEKGIKMEKTARESLVSKLDGIGFTVSSLCAIHCVLMPFAISLLPLIGLEFLAEPWVEVSIILFSVILGTWSLIPAYRKFHQNLKPIIFLIIGFVFILGAHFLGFHEFEPVLMPIGGMSIAAAHYFNWKLSKRYHGHSCTKH